jgi:hypothetical protein
MTEQEELVQDIRERLGEMPKRALPFNLLAFTTTIGQRYSMAPATRGAGTTILRRWKRCATPLCAIY